MSDAEAQKRAAGEAAAALVEDGMALGLGTGSTAAWFVRALGARVAAGELRVRGVPTSEATARLAREVGVPLTSLDEAGELDLTVDGADEIAPNLDCLKGVGGGGAQLREKLVWEASRRRLVVADAGKPVAALGALPVPVEVVAFGHGATARRIGEVVRGLGVVATRTLRSRDGERFLTDSGNMIYDLRCDAIADAVALGAQLKAATGVVEHGLFLGLATEALIGTVDGVKRLAPPQRDG